MTHTERKLRKNLAEQIDNGQIVVKHSKSIEVCVRDADEDIDHSATADLALRVAGVFYWEGHRNGWGGWTIEPANGIRRGCNTR